MNDWTSTILGELCQLKGGSGFKTDFQGRESGVYPFIKVSDMNLSGNERKIHTANNWVSSDDLKQLKAKAHPAGSVVFAKIGIALTYNRRRILTQPTIIDNNMMAAISNAEKVDAKFLYYLLTTIDFNLLVKGSALPYINASDVAAVAVSLPPLPEQRAIASILGSLDEKIELNRRQNATLEQMAQRVFRAWFVDFEPVRAKVAGIAPACLDPETAALFPDEFDGDLPEGWEIEPLDGVAHFLNGLALQKFPPVGDETDLPVIKISQLRKGSTDDDEKANAKIAQQYKIKNGDVLFSWSGTLEVRVWNGGEGALNQHLFKVTSERFPKWFYYFWTLHHLAQFREIAANKATTMGHIQRHHLTEAKVWVPNHELLTRLDEIIAPLLAQIENNLQQSRTLAAIRDQLLPRLLSGALRVPDSLLARDESSLGGA